MTTTAPHAPGQAALKQQLKRAWSAGNYAKIAETLQPSSQAFLERHPVRRGARVLDVACGAGQIALPAARMAAQVTGVDIADNLLRRARARAAREGLAARFEVADAESLPCADNSFDQVYSLIGAMFAPRPERVASELVRACKPGGQIVMGNWTAQGFVGQLFQTVARHVPSPPHIPSPLLWGSEVHARDRFGANVASISFERQVFEFRYPFGPQEVVALFRRYFGPIIRAFEALDDKGQAELHDELVQLWDRHNQAAGGTTHTEAEILEIVAVPA